MQFNVNCGRRVYNNRWTPSPISHFLSTSLSIVYKMYMAIFVHVGGGACVLPDESVGRLNILIMRLLNFIIRKLTVFIILNFLRKSKLNNSFLHNRTKNRRVCTKIIHFTRNRNTGVITMRNYNRIITLFAIELILLYFSMHRIKYIYFYFYLKSVDFDTQY